MLAGVPNLFYAFGLPVLSMAICGVIAVALYRVLGSVLRP